MIGVSVGLAQNLSLLSSLLFLPFGMETYVLRLSYHCTLEAHNLFDFTESQLESNFPQDERILNPVHI